MSTQWNITVKLNDGTATVDALLSEKVGKCVSSRSCVVNFHAL